MRAFMAGFTDSVWFAGTSSVKDGSGSVELMLSIWYSVPGAFGGCPNSSVSSVSSTHCPGLEAEVGVRARGADPDRRPGNLADRRDDRAVLPRPLEGGLVLGTALVDLDSV